MPSLSIYLDECIDHRLAEVLRERGYDILTVQEARTRHDDDESQLLYATTHSRILLSHNQIDFGRLHVAFQRDGRSHGGLAVVPQTVPFSRLQIRTLLMLDWIATFPEPDSRLFRWGELQQRLIHGYRLPEWSERDVRRALGWEE